MTRRGWLRLLLWSVTAVAVGLEIWGAAANTGATWTETLVDLVPAPVTLGLVAALDAWLPGHFREFYAAKGTSMQPTMTTTKAKAAALVGVIIGPALALAVPAMADGHVTGTEAWMILGAALSGLATAITVWATPNKVVPPA